MDPLLSIFPTPLLTRILCGGDGLAPAYGPLDGTAWSSRYSAAVWNPETSEAHAAHEYTVRVMDRGELTTEAEGWRLPLDHWRTRLALVAAWMLDHRDERYAWIDVRGADGDRIGLSVSFVLAATWEIVDGRGGAALNLPTLPAHLADHDPAVALVLALYDVTEIRDRLR